MICFLSPSPSVSPSALRPPPWLPKQCPRFLSVPERHGILVVLPAELPVLPPDPPLLRLPVSPTNQQRGQLLLQPDVTAQRRSLVPVRPPSERYIIPTEPSSSTPLCPDSLRRHCNTTNIGTRNTDPTRSSSLCGLVNPFWSNWKQCKIRREGVTHIQTENHGTYKHNVPRKGESQLCSYMYII